MQKYPLKTPAQMIKPFLNKWNCIGAQYNRTYVQHMLYISTLLFCMIATLSSVLNIITTKSITMINIVDNTVVASSFFQVFIKLTVCYWNQSVIQNLIKIIQNEFRFPEMDAILKQTLKRIYNITNVSARTYFFAVLSCYIYMFSSIFAGNFGWDIWVPFNKDILKQFPWYEIVVAVQLIIQGMAAFFAMVPIDLFFIINMSIVYTQFQLLKHKFKYIGNDNEYKIIIDIVRHHNTILKFIKYLKILYTEVILVVFVGQCLTLTLSLYVNYNYKQSSSMRFIVLEVTALLQILFYCVCGQILDNANQSISQEAYNSNWEFKMNRNTIAAIQNIICCTQNTQALTAGGYMVVSLKTYVNIIRTIFSFVTVLRNTIKNE